MPNTYDNPEDFSIRGSDSTDTCPTDTNIHKMSPWKPEQDQYRLAVLGKLVEELGEASAIVARCIIQGIDEHEPTTKEPNRLALENELADVVAGMRLAIEIFGLSDNRITERVLRKMSQLRSWHALLPLP